MDRLIPLILVETCVSLLAAVVVFLQCAKKKEPQCGKKPPGSSACSVMDNKNKQPDQPKSAMTNTNNSKVSKMPPSQSHTSNMKSQETGEKTSNMAVSKESAVGSTVKPAESALSNVSNQKDADKPPKVPDEDYGEVAEPTASAKKRRQKDLEKDKEDKVKKGFYQPQSDEDDTLEPIKSLKQENSNDVTNKTTKKKKSKREKAKTKTDKDDKNEKEE